MLLNCLCLVLSVNAGWIELNGMFPESGCALNLLGVDWGMALGSRCHLHPQPPSSVAHV